MKQLIILQLSTLLLLIQLVSSLWIPVIEQDSTRGPIAHSAVISRSATSCTVLFCYTHGDIMSVDMLNHQKTWFHTQVNPVGFQADVSTAAYSQEQEGLYVATQDGGLYKLSLDQKSVGSWTPLINSTDSKQTINNIIPYTNIANLDLYYSRQDGSVLEHSPFFSFENSIFLDLQNIAACTHLLFTDFLSNPELPVEKLIVTGFDNGAIVKSRLAYSNYDTPESFILQPAGSKITSMIIYRSSGNLWLLTGEGNPQGYFKIFDLQTNNLLFQSSPYQFGVQDVQVFQGADLTENILVALQDGTIFEYPIADLTSSRILASSDFFGGSPIVQLHTNWLDSANSGNTPVPIVVVATAYGTIAALLTNETSWRLLATPNEFGSVALITGISAITSEFNEQGVPISHLLIELSNGEADLFTNWHLLSSQAPLNQQLSQVYITSQDSRSSIQGISFFLFLSFLVNLPFRFNVSHFELRPSQSDCKIESFSHNYSD
jgi:hypothetical protein